MILSGILPRITPGILLGFLYTPFRIPLWIHLEIVSGILSEIPPEISFVTPPWIPGIFYQSQGIARLHSMSSAAIPLGFFQGYSKGLHLRFIQEIFQDSFGDSIRDSFVEFFGISFGILSGIPSFLSRYCNKIYSAISPKLLFIRIPPGVYPAFIRICFRIPSVTPSFLILRFLREFVQGFPQDYLREL